MVRRGCNKWVMNDALVGGLTGHEIGKNGSIWPVLAVCRDGLARSYGSEHRPAFTLLTTEEFPKRAGNFFARCVTYLDGPCSHFFERHLGERA